MLRKNIKNNELLITMFNYFNLVAIGVVPAILSLVDMMCNWPFFVYISFKMQNNIYGLPEHIQNLHESYSFEIEVLGML